MSVKAAWHVIPDGTTSIVQLTLEVEFYVQAVDAAEQTEAGVRTLIARMTGRSEEEVQAAMTNAALSDLFMGDLPRPEEPAT